MCRCCKKLYTCIGYLCAYAAREWEGEQKQDSTNESRCICICHKTLYIGIPYVYLYTLARFEVFGDTRHSTHAHMYMNTYTTICIHIHIYVYLCSKRNLGLYMHAYITNEIWRFWSYLLYRVGWLQSVRFSNCWVTFAKVPYTNGFLCHKEPSIARYTHTAIVATESGLQYHSEKERHKRRGRPDKTDKETSPSNCHANGNFRIMIKHDGVTHS